MADDNKRQPFQDNTASQDQQKGGEATATDQDVTDLGSETEVPTDTSELEDDASAFSNDTTGTESTDDETSQ